MNESHWGDATSWMSNNIATPPPAAHSWSQHVVVKQLTLYDLRVASQNKQQKFTLTPNMQVCNVINSPYRIKIKPNIQSGSTSTTSGSSPRVPPAIGTETQSYNITQLALLIHLSIYRLWLCGVTETLAVNAAVAGGQSFMSDISPLTHSQAN